MASKVIKPGNFILILLFVAALANQVFAKTELKSPEIGKADAPVTIVEYTDFECYFCGMVQSSLKKVLEMYPNQVKLVFKNFPLRMHKFARGAHSAAMCAHEQGKFWDYRFHLFSHQKDLDKKDLLDYAALLQLDTKQFDQCLNENKYVNKIEEDFNEGVSEGVMGTPTFFINGKAVSGALSFDSFKFIIEKELSQSR